MNAGLCALAVVGSSPWLPFKIIWEALKWYVCVRARVRACAHAHHRPVESAWLDGQGCPEHRLFEYLWLLIQAWFCCLSFEWSSDLLQSLYWSWKIPLQISHCKMPFESCSQWISFLLNLKNVNNVLLVVFFFCFCFFALEKHGGWRRYFLLSPSLTICKMWVSH